MSYLPGSDRNDFHGNFLGDGTLYFVFDLCEQHTDMCVLVPLILPSVVSMCVWIEGGGGGVSC